jgi:hypothetical protein
MAAAKANGAHKIAREGESPVEDIRIFHSSNEGYCGYGIIFLGTLWGRPNEQIFGPRKQAAQRN